eukprot:scaffold2264_cov114-Isochrysis_galbana.AAC.5
MDCQSVLSANTEARQLRQTAPRRRRSQGGRKAHTQGSNSAGSERSVSSGVAFFPLAMMEQRRLTLNLAWAILGSARNSMRYALAEPRTLTHDKL